MYFLLLMDVKLARAIGIFLLSVVIAAVAVALAVTIVTVMVVGWRVFFGLSRRYRSRCYINANDICVVVVVDVAVAVDVAVVVVVFAVVNFDSDMNAKGE